MPPLEHNDAATDDYKDGNFNDVKVFNFRMEEGRLSLSKPPKFPICWKLFQDKRKTESATEDI